MNFKSPDYLPPHKREKGHTLFAEWLSSRGVSKSGFARLIGTSYKTIEYWCWGQVTPDLVNAYLIEKITEGGVPASSWLASPIGKLLWNYRMQFVREAEVEDGA